MDFMGGLFVFCLTLGDYYVMIKKELKQDSILFKMLKGATYP